jgi:putative CocE/NonD family hydrolase
MKLWVILAVLVLVAGLLLVEHHRHLQEEHAALDMTTATITTPDGVELSAEVFTPQNSGAHPLVVMPTSWGAEETQYRYVAALFAANGFQVVAYTQRGFKNSGGQIDFAGTATVKDVGTVIDWALKHADVNASEIGMLGDSYGAGVSLLAAEKDPRIKAVAALSTWTDWGYSFAPNSTISTESLATLISVGQSSGRLGPAMTKLGTLYKTNPTAALAQIHAMAPSRSPIDGVAALNSNHTAVMLANGMQDSIFSPTQLVNFYDKLTGPKRLEIAVGDHTQPEVPGFLTGKKIGPVGDALSWLSHYLVGTDNGINTEAPIELQDAVTGTEHTYATWPTTAIKETLPLPDATTSTSHAAGGWTVNIDAGALIQAQSEPETRDLTVPYQFATANIDSIPTSAGLRWSSPALASALTVSGTSSVTLDVACTASTASFFVYLYDVAPTGVGKLMSVTPDTVTHLDPGTPRVVSLSLTPTSWTVPAGDHVALVLGTVDARWGSQNTPASTLTVSSSASSTAELSLPTA